MDLFTDIIVTMIMVPIVVVFAPIDAFLQFIPGIEQIPIFLNSMTQYLVGIPSTMVAITGLSPLLWNLAFNIFVLYIFLSPAVNIIKIVFEWIRS